MTKLKQMYVLNFKFSWVINCYYETEAHFITKLPKIMTDNNLKKRFVPDKWFQKSLLQQDRMDRVE